MTYGEVDQNKLKGDLIVNINNNNTYNNSNHNQLLQGDNSVSNINNLGINNEIESQINNLKKELINQGKQDHNDIVDLLETSIKENKKEKSFSLLKSLKEVIGATETFIKFTTFINGYFH